MSTPKNSRLSLFRRLDETAKSLPFFHPKRVGLEILSLAWLVLLFGVFFAGLGLVLGFLAFVVALFGGCPKSDSVDIVTIVYRFVPIAILNLWLILVFIFTLSPRLFMIIMAFLWGGFRFQAGISRLVDLRRLFEESIQSIGRFQLYLKLHYFFATVLFSAGLTATLFFSIVRIAWALPLGVRSYTVQTGLFLLAVFFTASILTAIYFALSTAKESKDH